MKYAALSLCIASASALAQPTTGAWRIEMAIGESIELDVGYARGVRCDDLTIVSAELRAKNESTNVLVVTARQPGQTLCRAGTDLNRVSYLYQFVVYPPDGSLTP